MEVSPFRRWLYRTAGTAVICLLAAGAANPQGLKQDVSKGPRAVGLLALSANGKAHLIPIVILNEGQYYDASAYKAAPVPMALESGTVYEAVKTGVSQGLFTVSAASPRKDMWIGLGSWEAAGSKPAARPAADAKPKEEVDEPPRLRRPGAEPPKPPEPKPEETKPQAPAVAPPVAANPTPPPPPPEDKDRPKLRRGKPTSQPEEPESATDDAVAKPAFQTSPGGSKTNVDIQLIPAISDADGPEPRSYAYNMKPDEESQFRNKMLAMAADELRAQIKQLSPSLPEATAPKAPAAGHKKTLPAKVPPPAFDNVQLRVLDLSSSNEPVLVLTAEARPSSSAPTTAAPYFIAFVARQNIYGELHKVFAQVTDAQHMDALPRMEFVDAVDADGDGRGELLFRRSYDDGSAFGIYRVIGDQLWPLFEGTPSKGMVN